MWSDCDSLHCAWRLFYCNNLAWIAGALDILDGKVAGILNLHRIWSSIRIVMADFSSLS